MYKFYRGEKTNPFSAGTKGHMFWFYESIFERDYNHCDNADWYSLFSTFKKGDSFLALVKDENKKVEKAQLFKFWLGYLFGDKLDAKLRDVYDSLKVVK